MAGLLPSKPDIDPSDEPRVVGLDSDAADELIDALSSTTTRTVLAALHEEPASASELAERVDTSLQNVQYHLRKLEDAGLVEVGDTVYSEKGREMNVYTPADRALVVVAGREEETTGLKAALSRLLGGIGVLGVASVLVDRLVRRGLSLGFGAAGGADGTGGADGGDAGGAAEPQGGGDGGAGGGAADVATPTPTETATTTPEPSTATPASTTTSTDGGGFEIAEATTTTTGPTGTTTPVETAAETATTAEPTATELATPTTTPPLTETATPTATPVTGTDPTPAADLTAEAVGTATAAQPSFAAGLAASPGLLFFLGGTTVLVGGFALWWVTR